jgi:2-keto-4-pentenoate hydratase/2-oxohepta-3-ene-1,7-dioic acid hydratase in catechol pathway
MRILNVAGRLALAVGDGAVDVAQASNGTFGPDVQAIYGQWTRFREWASSFSGQPSMPIEPARLGAPAPLPPQVFAVGLNYREHAQEAGAGTDSQPYPTVFTKFPASVTGPFAEIMLSGDTVDYEAELCVVIGKRADCVTAAGAWDYVAGLTVGQDISDRHVQLAGAAPQQYCIAKSYRGFAPVGPWLVTPDEFANPDDLELSCTLNSQLMQKARTSDMIFPVPQIIEYLSSVVSLLPGDLVFTGTPSGIGWARDPKRLLRPGDELVTSVQGIGQTRHFCTAPPAV